MAKPMTDSYLRELEDEAIYILRETAASFKNPVMLYSVGKDSSTMVRLATKAFAPAKIPFPLMHVDTGYKFAEMYEFRDTFCKTHNLRLIVERNEEWIKKKAHPSKMGTECFKEAQFRRRHRRREKRGRKIQSQGTGLFGQGQIRAMGSKKPKTRIMESLQHFHQRR